MKIKQLFTFIAALTILGGAVSCSNDELQSIDQTEPATEALSDKVPINISTYVGQARDTRAGTTGSIEDVATLQTTGFGVFAHFTKSNDYETTLYGNATGKYKDAETVATNSAASILEVYNNGQATYADNIWTVKYGDNEAVRYWPNPSRKEDGSTVPQYVSFFAYAPFAGTDSPGEIKDATWGIKGWKLVHSLITSGGSENMDALSKAIKDSAYRDCDPVIHYSATKGDDGKMVDLLWGTAGTNGVTYADAEQKGNKVGDETTTTTTGDDGQTTTTPTVDREGHENVNIDLQKMKSDGKVGFNFKHALSKLGGINGVYADIKGVKDNDNDDTRSVNIRWIAIELTNTATATDGSTLNVPTDGYFNLATGKWATDPTTVASNETQVPMVYFLSSATTNFQNTGYGQDFAYYYLSKNQKGEFSNLTADEQTTIKNLEANTVFCTDGFSGTGWREYTQEDYADDKTDGRGEHPEVGDPIEDKTLTSTSKSLIKQTYTNYTYDDDTGKFLSKSPVSIPAFYLIPDASKAKIQAKVTVNWQFGGNTYQTQSEEIGLPELKYNTAYKLYIHLNVESIKVDATVDKWTESTGEAAAQNSTVYPGPGNNSKPTDTGE